MHCDCIVYIVCQVFSYLLMVKLLVRVIVIISISLFFMNLIAVWCVCVCVKCCFSDPQ